LEEGKYVKLLCWEGKDAAKITISEAIQRYKKSIDV
jgi:inorganic pyrophosphatase